VRNKLLYAIALAVAIATSSCAAAAMTFEDFNRAWEGIPATITTYDQDGNLIDSVRGTSLEISLDERFYTVTVSSDGTTTREPGDVLLISIGDSIISHVGSTMIWAEDGVEAIAGADTTVDIENFEAGTPWLNEFKEYGRNLWQGKAKTLLIRSQDGKPIAVYAANQVEIVGTAVPKSTMFRLDGKRLFVYRADYTMYDTDLL
jgi:hypothetical protein